MVSRVLIVSPEWRQLEALLLRDARFHILDALPDDSTLPGAVNAFSPGLLIWQGCSFPMYLSHVTATPPRVLCLLDMHKPTENAAEADVGILLPAADTDVLDAAARAALLPLPRLASDTCALRHTLSADMLCAIGMPGNLKGCRYILEGVAACACSPALLDSCRDRLYPWLSARFSASPAAIERAIRTAIENAWLRGDLNGIQRLFGFSVDAERGKPTNVEFLSTLAQQVRQQVQRQLPDSAVHSFAQ